MIYIGSDSNFPESNGANKFGAKPLDPGALSEALQAKQINQSSGKFKKQFELQREEEIERGADTSLKARFPEAFKYGEDIFRAANSLQESAYPISALTAALDVYAFEKFFGPQVQIRDLTDTTIIPTRSIPQIAESLHRLVENIDRVATSSRDYANYYFETTDPDHTESRLATNLLNEYQRKGRGEALETLTSQVQHFIEGTTEIGRHLSENLDRLIHALEHLTVDFLQHKVTALETSPQINESKSEDLLAEARKLRELLNPEYGQSLPTLLLELRAIFSPRTLVPTQFEHSS